MDKSDLETGSLVSEVEARRQRGAGGKVRKPPSRRPSATPYARSQQNQAQRSSRWLSRLVVDPACRLISGGANLVLPYLFSKPQSANDSITLGDAREEEGEDHQLRKVEGDPNAADNDDGNVAFNHVVSRSTEVAGTSKVADVLKNDGHQHLKKADRSAHCNLSEIEQLMKHTNFSRDEIMHLTKILRSRAIDLPNVGQEKKDSSVIADIRGSDARSAFALEYSGKPTEEKKENFSGTLWGISEIPDKKYLAVTEGDVGMPVISFEKSKKPTKENHEDLNAAILGTSTPLLQSTLEDHVGSSPIEIAKAYMKNQTLEAGCCSLSSNLNDQETFSQGKAFPSKSLIPSTRPKTSTCWPGAMTQDRGYMTPQTQRGRFGFNSFPRTPYSRTILKSKSKVLGDGNKHLNMTSTPLQPSLTPTSGQVASNGRMSYDSHGSVGPIRRSRHRVLEATARGSAYFHSLSKSSQVENFDVSEGSFSTAKKNFQDGGRNSSSKFLSADSKLLNSEVSVPSFPAYSRQMTRKILDLLERNPVTPKDKSAELKLAISSNQAQSSEVTAFPPKKDNGLAYSGAFNSLSKPGQGGSNNCLLLREDGGNSLFKFSPLEVAKDSAKNKFPPLEVTKDSAKNKLPPVEVAKDAVKNSPSASDVKVNCSTVSTSGNDVRPSKDFKQYLDSQVMSSQQVVSDVAVSEVPRSEKKLQSHSSATKPVLPSISIDKPGQGWTFSSDKSSGFTFPVSSSFGVSSEPPTPSIMPLSSASGLHPSKDESSIPSYTFGKKRSSPALVFSFPSTSSTPHAQDDASDLKFTFGSDKNSRIFFSSLGKDAVCY